MVDLTNDQVKHSIGQFITERKQTLNMTNQRLASLSGISERTIGRYTSGDVPQSAIREDTFFTLLTSLDSNIDMFKQFLHQNEDSQSSSSGATININTDNKFENSPIGAQGNITFNITSKDKP